MNARGQFGKRVGDGWGRALDLLLPPRCLACGTDVAGSGAAGSGALCAACWNGLDFLSAPWCACCGTPFLHEPGLLPDPQARCGACISSPPSFARARSALAYDDGSRRLILPFKHGDRLDMTPLLGRWLGRAASELLPGIDLVAPVPLHWTRLFTRRFNQSSVLAAAMLAARPAVAGHATLVPDLLKRRRRTPTQEGRSRTGRARNVASAFAVGPRRDPSGRRILLVDDVLTTGATVEECARVLRRAGAASVDIVTLARVIRVA